MLFEEKKNRKRGREGETFELFLYLARNTVLTQKYEKEKKLRDRCGKDRARKENSGSRKTEGIR